MFKSVFDTVTRANKDKVKIFASVVFLNILKCAHAILPSPSLSKYVLLKLLPYTNKRKKGRGTRLSIYLKLKDSHSVIQN